MSRRLKIPVGSHFNRLTVLGEAGSNAYGHRLLHVRCACGTEKLINAAHLRGRTKSCGCLQRELAAQISNKAIRLKPGAACLNLLFSSYRRAAQKRGLKFGITLQLFTRLTQQPCHYCGQPPAQVLRTKHTNGAYTYNGLDRIVNAQGYTPENTVPCCGNCNTAKGTKTLAEFKTWLARAAQHTLKHEYLRP